jgi:hypothetical protein
MAVVVELKWDALALEHLPEEEEVALGVLLLAKEGGNDSAGGVIYGAQKGGLRPIRPDPVGEASVDLQEHSFLSSAVATAAVSGRPAALLGLLPGPTAKALHGRPAEEDALIAEKQLLQMAVVAVGIASLAQGHDHGP